MSLQFWFGVTNEISGDALCCPSELQNHQCLMAFNSNWGQRSEWQHVYPPKPGILELALIQPSCSTTLHGLRGSDNTSVWAHPYPGCRCGLCTSLAQGTRMQILPADFTSMTLGCHNSQTHHPTPRLMWGKQIKFIDPLPKSLIFPWHHFLSKAYPRRLKPFTKYLYFRFCISQPVEESGRSLSYLGLERAEDMSQEWVLPSQGENSLLYHRTLNVIIHQHHVLLQGFHSKILVCALQLGQEHLRWKQLLRKRDYLFSEQPCEGGS